MNPFNLFKISYRRTKDYLYQNIETKSYYQNKESKLKFAKLINSLTKKSCARFFLLSATFLTLSYLTIYFLFIESELMRKTSCFLINFTEQVNYVPEMIQLVNKSKSSLFFLETSCKTIDDEILSSRQACSIESAALTNPNSDIYVLLISPFNLDDSRNLSLKQFKQIQILRKYKNIHFRYINYENYIKNTPIENYVTLNRIRHSIYPIVHTSDILRWVTLWKYGGTYLDLDMILLKSLEDLGENYTGAESDEDISVGVMNFDRNSTGHKFVEQILIDLKHNYNANSWSTNANGAITRLFQRVCGTKKVSEMTPHRCKNFRIFQGKTFYPVPYKKWQMYFNESYLKDVLKLIENSIGVHVWNHLSGSKNVVGSQTAYGYLAKKWCPNMYLSVKDSIHIFSIKMMGMMTGHQEGYDIIKGFSGVI